ncbi:MAG: tetratricopeptide repeat protein [Saprospiraceae bacterium]
MAMELLQSALQNDLDNFGENHKKIAYRYNSIAFVMSNTGDFKESIIYFQKAINILKAIFKEEHPDINTTSRNLFNTIQKGGKAGGPDLQKRWAEIQKEQEE